MRKFLKAAAAMMLIAAVAVTSFAVVSIDMSTGSGGGTASGGGGGGGGAATITNQEAAAAANATEGGLTPTSVATTTENPSNGGETVQASTSDWKQNADGTWSLNNYRNQWKNATNPYAGGTPQWFYFDANGIMATGWRWITGADGRTYCYYFNPASDGSKGMAVLGGTVGGYQLDAQGRWVVNGVVQTK